jgi:hypothetical protein
MSGVPAIAGRLARRNLGDEFIRPGVPQFEPQLLVEAVDVACDFDFQPAAESRVERRTAPCPDPAFGLKRSPRLRAIERRRLR